MSLVDTLTHLLPHANLYLSHSTAICLSFTLDSVPLSALLTYPSPFYHTDLLYKLPDATDLPPM